MFRNVQLPNTSKNLQHGCANQQFAIVTVIIIIIIYQQQQQHTTPLKISDLEAIPF